MFVSPHSQIYLRSQDPREESLRQNLEQLSASKRYSLLHASLAEWQNGVDGKEWARDHTLPQIHKHFPHGSLDPAIAGNLVW